MSRLGFGGLEVSKMLLFSIGLSEKRLLPLIGGEWRLKAASFQMVVGCRSFIFPRSPCVVWRPVCPHWGLENGSMQEVCLPRCAVLIFTGAWKMVLGRRLVCPGCGVQVAVEIHIGTSAPQEKNHSAKPVMASGSA